MGPGLSGWGMLIVLPAGEVSHRNAVRCLRVAIRDLWTAGCFSDSACLCFRLPSSDPRTHFRPRWEYDTLGLSEDEYDCISARSMRQYRSLPCPSWDTPFGGLSHS